MAYYKFQRERATSCCTLMPHLDLSRPMMRFFEKRHDGCCASPLNSRVQVQLNKKSEPGFYLFASCFFSFPEIVTVGCTKQTVGIHRAQVDCRRVFICMLIGGV